SETGGAVSYQLASAGLFVDQTGWYDVCLSCSDTGYMRMHVNGALVGELDASAHVSYVGKAVEHRIGSGGDCYVAGVHFAQEVLAPTAFGEFSIQVSGLWVPRR
ncbi:hypothetical protein, partial [Desulfovibrio oxyclinae]|uniref:hypothetical protein n=1 Tax=Desulfovibrio oxyclinae TaxID=63560 RepID=UPI00058BF43A